MRIRIVKKPSWLPEPSQWPARKLFALLAGFLVMTAGCVGVYSVSDLVFSEALKESSRIIGDSATSAPPTPLTSLTSPTPLTPSTPSTTPTPSVNRAVTLSAGPALPNPAQFQHKGPDFFSEYRMERERVRSQQIEILQEIVRNDQSSGETRKEAQKKLLQISEQIKKEMETERLLIANDYRDAVALIQGNTVSVIVAARELTPADKGKIAELVARSTGVKAGDVAVMNR
ncbi:hypothetical protein GTO89_09480 [Heliobacterium gestii]|uniref:Stage III sporulation protein AH n=1 Tax=Heliomicrobium gestii TaxID=2699 RepID=A0A845LF79_HELGE|nr:SpoIIIAH-like family protein [Heliomicrobium gestii]MBM7867920.1 stage III sporulation protein AH [Heliomicrobium gestii]MZP43269.1 hypothetical protein [Heliomicrobium gestii]